MVESTFFYCVCGFQDLWFIGLPVDRPYPTQIWKNIRSRLLLLILNYVNLSSKFFSCCFNQIKILRKYYISILVFRLFFLVGLEISNLAVRKTSYCVLWELLKWLSLTHRLVQREREAVQLFWIGISYQLQNVSFSLIKNVLIAWRIAGMYRQIWFS